MKQYKNKKYEGKWEHKTAYYHQDKKKANSYQKKTTYPWKHQKKTYQSN